MNRINLSYPTFPVSSYQKKLVKGFPLRFALTSSDGNKILRKGFNAVGFDQKEVFVNLVRGFAGDDNFLSKFRF